MTKEEKAAAKAAKKAERKAKGEGLWNDFKKFISKGNVLDMAVGVIIGGAFNAIVTALVNILMSVCTWGVPGGIKGLVTVLPAANATQAGVPGIGQYFTDLKAATSPYAASQGVTITESSDTYVQWQNSLKNLYTLHGTTWTYNLSAVIDWGTFINAIISFIIIAITLFVIVRTVKSVKAKSLAWQAQIQEEYYKKHPEERPAPEPEPVKKPTTEELLTAILGELQAQNGAKKTEEAK